MKTKSFLTNELLQQLTEYADKNTLQESKIEILSEIGKAPISPESDRKKIVLQIARIKSNINLQAYLYNLRLKHDGCGVI